MVRTGYEIPVPRRPTPLIPFSNAPVFAWVPGAAQSALRPRHQTLYRQ